MNEWIWTNERLPDTHEIVLIFHAPRRVLAQYVPGRESPWNLMDGNYLSNDEVLMWAPIADHPYGGAK